MKVAVPTSDAHWEQFTAVEGETFATTPADTSTYIAAVRPSAIARFAFEDDRVIGGALAFPCTQHIGGLPVTSGAVASVCVAPEHRGTGVGRAIMGSLVRAMGDEHVAIASLWPTSVSFYRRIGWELAGSVGQYTVPAAALRGLTGMGDALRDPPLDEVRELRASLAPRWSGPVERPWWWWHWRLPTPAVEQTYRYGWREDGALTGFTAFRRQQAANGRWGFDVWVSDFWASTGNALNGLLALLASDGSLSPEIRFGYGVLPDTPDLQWRLPELDLRVDGTNAWMLRALDPAAAIAQAGWPAHVAGRLTIEVAGVGQGWIRFAAEFAAGRAQTSATDVADIRMAAGTLAAWYSGALSARQAAMLGQIGGSPEDIALMDRLTADRRPWLPDMF